MSKRCLYDKINCTARRRFSSWHSSPQLLWPRQTNVELGPASVQRRHATYLRRQGGRLTPPPAGRHPPYAGRGSRVQQFGGTADCGGTGSAGPALIDRLRRPHRARAGVSQSRPRRDAERGCFYDCNHARFPKTLAITTPVVRRLRRPLPTMTNNFDRVRSPAGGRGAGQAHRPPPGTDPRAGEDSPAHVQERCDDLRDQQGRRGEPPNHPPDPRHSRDPPLGP